MKSSRITNFLLSVFVFSWSLWGAAIWTDRPATSFPTVIFYMLGGSGPSLVAVYFVLRTFDREARRDFWSRLFAVRRIGPIWWVICLLVIPAVMILAVALDVLLGGTRPPMPNLQMLLDQPVGIPIFVLSMFVGGALSEELGWRGILLDSFQKQWTALRSTLTLGTLWWIFHLPLFLLQGTPHYNWGLFTLMFWLFPLNVLLLAACITLAYNYNQRSILAAMLMHFSYNLLHAVLIPLSVRAFAMIILFLLIMVLAILKGHVRNLSTARYSS